MCNDNGGLDLRMGFQGVMIAEALTHGWGFQGVMLAEVLTHGWGFQGVMIAEAYDRSQRSPAR